jgi:AraC-like DNA-binding protein
VSEAQPDAERPWGTVYFNPHGSLYIGGGILNELHRHFAASLSFSLEGDYRVSAEGLEGWQTYRGLLVAPNVEQQMDARECRIVILLIDPETEAYDRIAHWFERDPIRPLPPELTTELARQTSETLKRAELDAFELWTRIIEALSRPGFVRRQRDLRIERALAILKQNVLTPPTASELARSVGLSEGRLIHLFTQEMGLPIRRYVLWLRLREVVFALAESASMTQAAHAAGFADSAHMSRTFREMFGLPPSLFLKTSRTIQRVFLLPPDDKVVYDPHDKQRWDRLRAKLGGS